MNDIHLVGEEAHEEEQRIRYIWRLCDIYIGRLMADVALLEKCKELLRSLTNEQVSKLLESFQSMSEQDLQRMIRSANLTRAVVPLSEIVAFREGRDKAEHDRIRVSEAQLELVFAKPENRC